MLESTIDLSSPRGALREVPFIGVIFVVAEAAKLGFTNGDPDWCNLGQGRPEGGEMAGAPRRIDTVRIRPEDHAYGPLGGIGELRERVAAHHNRLHRRGGRGRPRFTAADVAVAQGGRLALSRAIAALGAVNVGFPLPDYTACEDMLGLHLGRVNPIPLRTREQDGFRVTRLQALEPRQADQETRALRDTFANKRNVMVRVNPGKRRRAPSPYRQWMRFSFGPPLENVELGLDRLAKMLRRGG